MLPDVTIIIPTYQGYNWLTETLPALRQQNYPGSVEILAIDSGSTDSTVALLNRYNARVITISQAAFSHGYARNLGVQNAKTDVIVFISQDVLPIGRDWLTRLVCLLDDPGIGAAHVRQLARPNATPFEVFFHEELYPPVSKRYRWKSGERLSLDKMFFSNVCSITRRELSLRFPFPEDLIMSEDQYYAKALLQAGYQTLYSADVTVYHSHSYDLKTLFRRNFDSAYSLLGIADDGASKTVSSGLRFIRRECAYMIRHRYWLWLAYLPLYETTRIAGRLFGKQAMRLPRWLRIKMSLHRGFWTGSHGKPKTKSTKIKLLS